MCWLGGKGGGGGGGGGVGSSVYLWGEGVSYDQHISESGFYSICIIQYEIIRESFESH